MDKSARRRPSFWLGSSRFTSAAGAAFDGEDPEGRIGASSASIPALASAFDPPTERASWAWASR
jgi:hypothetical protein